MNHEVPILRQDLTLSSPWMNAAGMLGFAPKPPDAAKAARLAAKPARWPAGETPGAFVTNPISLGPRTPASDRCQAAYPGGVLLHSGLPNPGISRVLRKYSERWKQSDLPIWVHLIGSNPGEIQQMVQRLEGREGVMAIELGLPPDASGDEALAFVEAAYGELPVVVHLSMTSAGEAWVKELPRHGASAISLGAPRGRLPKTACQPQLASAPQPTGTWINGRLYGPSLFPLMVAAVKSVQRLGIPIIAGAGVYSRQAVETLREAGAWAAQIDTVLWQSW